MTNLSTYRLARLTKDPRFDGLFYLGVKTTGIYCRPICPATPLEKNVEYFTTAHQAIKAGYRPCLRCHPDSAPGVSVTKIKHQDIFNKAANMMQEENFEAHTIQKIAENIGISSRHLRNIFVEETGISPKTYALLQQTLFAKKLLHQTTLPITEVAYASGFNSIRRFNDYFKKLMGMCPSKVRKINKRNNGCIDLKLHYRPPYDWEFMRLSFDKEKIDNMEWILENKYGRTFTQDGTRGGFTAEIDKKNNCFKVTIELERISLLRKIVYKIRRILDVDTDIESVKSCLNHYSKRPEKIFKLTEYPRIPGKWSVYEAGICAIIEQSKDDMNAQKNILAFVHNLGFKSENGHQYFPTPCQVQENAEQLKKIGIVGALLDEIMMFTQTNIEMIESEVLKHINNLTPRIISMIKIYALGEPNEYLGEEQFDQNSRRTQNEKYSPYRSYHYLQTRIQNIDLDPQQLINDTSRQNTTQA